MMHDEWQFCLGLKGGHFSIPDADADLGMTLGGALY
jgi:hypothetical protein